MEKVEKDEYKISKKIYKVTIKIEDNHFTKEDFGKMIYQYALNELKYEI